MTGGLPGVALSPHLPCLGPLGPRVPFAGQGAQAASGTSAPSTLRRAVPITLFGHRPCGDTTGRNFATGLVSYTPT